MIEKRFSNYLQKINLLYPRQFGFRPEYSTNLALIALTDIIKSKIDEGIFVGSVFIYFTKAFDAINHNTLFQKLISYGITGPSLQFAVTYLIGSRQLVYPEYYHKQQLITSVLRKDLF